MNKTICLDKWETVVDKDYLEELKETNKNLLEACKEAIKTSRLPKREHELCLNAIVKAEGN